MNMLLKQIVISLLSLFTYPYSHEDNEANALQSGPNCPQYPVIIVFTKLGSDGCSCHVTPNRSQNGLTIARKSLRNALIFKVGRGGVGTFAGFTQSKTPSNYWGFVYLILTTPDYVGFFISLPSALINVNHIC